MNSNLPVVPSASVNLAHSIPELLFSAARLHTGRTAIEEHGQQTDYRDLPR